MGRRYVPIELVADQLKADRYAFLEAVRCANAAAEQRDRLYGVAVQATCERMDAQGACPDAEDDPCPRVFGEYCDACRRAVDEAQRSMMRLRGRR